MSILAWESLGIPRTELAFMTKEREVWHTLLELLPCNPILDMQMGGWTFGDV